MIINTKNTLVSPYSNSLGPKTQNCKNTTTEIEHNTIKNSCVISKIYFQGVQADDQCEKLENILKLSDIDEKEHNYILEALNNYAPKNYQEQKNILKELLAENVVETVAGKKCYNFDADTIFNYLDYMNGHDNEERQIVKVLMKDLLQYYTQEGFEDGMEEILFSMLNNNPQIYNSLKEVNKSIFKYTNKVPISQEQKDKILCQMFSLFEDDKCRCFSSPQKSKIIDKTVEALIYKGDELEDDLWTISRMYSNPDDYFDFLAEKINYTRQKMDCSANSDKHNPHFVIIDDFKNKFINLGQGYRASHGSIVEGVVKISSPNSTTERIDLGNEFNFEINDVIKCDEMLRKMAKKYKNTNEYLLIKKFLQLKDNLSESNIAFLKVLQKVWNGEKIDGINFSFSRSVNWQQFEKMFNKETVEHFDARLLSDKDKTDIRDELTNYSFGRQILLLRLIIKELNLAGVKTYRSIGNDANEKFNLFSILDTETVGATTHSGVECNFSQKSGDKTQEALGIYRLKPVIDKNNCVQGFSFFNDNKVDISLDDINTGDNCKWDDSIISSQQTCGTSYAAPRAMVESYYT